MEKYRVKQKKKGFIIKKRFLFLFWLKHKKYNFPSQGDAQSFINVSLNSE